MPLETRKKPSKLAKRILCVHEAGHVVIGWNEPLMSDVQEARVRFRKRRGATVFESRYVSLRDEQDYLAEIAVDLAGPMAEKVVFGRWTNMNVRDLGNARDSIEEMVCTHGMSPIGPLLLAGRENSQAMQARIEAEIERILAERVAYVEKRLRALRKQLDVVAKLLFEHKRLDTDAITEALGPRPEAKAAPRRRPERTNARRK